MGWGVGWGGDRGRRRIGECAGSSMSFAIYHKAVTLGLNRVDTSRERRREAGKGGEFMGPLDRWINTISTYTS